MTLGRYLFMRSLAVGETHELDVEEEFVVEHGPGVYQRKPR
jgi:hypothetical protein